MEIHPSDQLLRETFQQPTRLAGRIASHVRECRLCQERVKNFTISGWLRRPNNYENVLDRSIARLELWHRRHSAEKAEAPRLLVQLECEPPTKRLQLLQNDRSYQTWSLCELLLDLSHEKLFLDLSESQHTAESAYLLARRLDPLLYGAERIEDLKARALGCIANVFRMRYDLSESEATFKKAFRHLANGTGDPGERAALLNLNALLCRTQNKFNEAVSHLERAIRVSRRIQDNLLTVQSLGTIAEVLFLQGDWEVAIQKAREVLVTVEGLREPRTVLSARHNLALYLAKSGKVMESQAWLARSQSFYRQFSDPYTQSHLLWLKAAIATAQNDLRGARALFQESRSQLLRANLPHHARLALKEIEALSGY